jgi:ribosomal-protein-alanine N-acetyltransferase
MRKSMVAPVSDVAVRRMTLEDVDRIVEIENMSFHTPWTRENFQFELTENRCAVYVVGEIDGNVAGYGGMWKMVDEGHITNIAVDPKYRCRGIGDAILGTLVKFAGENGISAMTLEVRTQNQPAHSLYIKHGFKDEAIRKGYYTNPVDDAIIMWKHDV